MNHLFRELAPVTAGAWGEIEEEATRSLKSFLAARRLVDVNVEDAWATGSLSTGRVRALATAPAPGVSARQREVVPLVELRSEFSLERDELDAVDRGAPDPDLQPVIAASRAAAMSEDSAVFNGYEDGGITGICPASPHDPVAISDNYARYPNSVAHAVAVLRAAGVDGPYGIALGPRCYTGVIETTEHGGYPLLEHLRLILGGPVVWAPAVDGAVVLSMRGGDFELTLGQDFSIGYLDHDASTVRLHLEESMTFRPLTPEAAVHLAYA